MDRNSHLCVMGKICWPNCTVYTLFNCMREKFCHCCVVSPTILHTAVACKYYWQCIGDFMTTNAQLIPAIINFYKRSLPNYSCWCFFSCGFLFFSPILLFLMLCFILLLIQSSYVHFHDEQYWRPYALLVVNLWFISFEKEKAFGILCSASSWAAHCGCPQKTRCLFEIFAFCCPPVTWLSFPLLI